MITVVIQTNQSLSSTFLNAATDDKMEVTVSMRRKIKVGPPVLASYKAMTKNKKMEKFLVDQLNRKKINMSILSI